MFLMKNKHMSREKAYDQAKSELYSYRHKEDVERRVAREESLSTGAYFGPSQLDVGLQLEGAAYEDWKQWAQEESLRKRQEAAAMYTDIDNEQPSDTAETIEEEPLAEELEEDEEVSAAKDININS